MNQPPEKILLIQTAFLGDVILATSALESLHAAIPGAELHFLLRRGNESLLADHPFLNKLWVLDKRDKWKNTWRMIRELRKEKYDLVLNFQRFMTSGILAAFSGGRQIRGFRKNPLSALFSNRYPHEISADGTAHEIERNHLLYADLAPDLRKPKLYPGKAAEEIPRLPAGYICIAPASVWFTKQWPVEKWVEFLNGLEESITVCLIGAPGDKNMVSDIISKTENDRLDMLDLTGKLSLLASAALMKSARMNYVNDSAPLHLASAVNAPVTGVFCSTVPAFGFTPLSDNSHIVETTKVLSCRPCGLHGYRSCPEGHFRCALTIDSDQLKEKLS